MRLYKEQMPEKTWKNVDHLLQSECYTLGSQLHNLFSKGAFYHNHLEDGVKMQCIVEC